MTEQEIDKRCMEAFECIKETNDKIIKQSGPDNVMAACFLIKEKAITMIALIFRTAEQKEATKQLIKRMVAECPEVRGYVTIFRATMTYMEKNEVCDCIIRSLYTPKGNIAEVLEYKGDKIKKAGADLQFIDSSWNIWNNKEMKDKDKINEDYEAYKKKHPEKYGDVV